MRGCVISDKIYTWESVVRITHATDKRTVYALSECARLRLEAYLDHIWWKSDFLVDVRYNFNGVTK